MSECLKERRFKGGEMMTFAMPGVITAMLRYGLRICNVTKGSAVTERDRRPSAIRKVKGAGSFIRSYFCRARCQ